MKFLMLLFSLGVCYVSLPVTSLVVADEAAEAETAAVTTTEAAALGPHMIAPADAEMVLADADSSDAKLPELVLLDASLHLTETAAADQGEAEEKDAEAADDASDSAEDSSESEDEENKDADQQSDDDAESTAADTSDSADAKSADDDAAADKQVAAAKQPATKKQAAKGEAAAAKADDKSDAKDEKPKKKERKTYKVKPKRLKVDVSLDGAFVADKMTEVPLRPDSWSQYEIVEVVEHGATAHAGQTLVKFDDEKINEAIADLELDQHLSELAIRRAEQDFPRQEKTLTMDATEAERTDKNAKQDYDRYHKIDRPMILKSVDYSLKYAQFNLDYQQDELDQLEKMYEADDLTEETEEVVLKRSRNQLDFAKFNLESTKLNVDEILNVRLPRNDIRIKESLDRAELNLNRAKTALAVDPAKARFELEKQKQSRAKSLDRHVKLLADRDLMEIKAPVDGVVYYGECVDGRWGDLPSLLKKLEPHNTVSSGTVLMTILDVRPMHVLAVADEAKRADLATGQTTKIAPPADDSEPLAGKVKSVSTAPVASGKFAVAVDLTGSDLPEWIVPGVSCKMKITTYDKSDALAVPKKAVHTDEDDEDVKYVWLVDTDDADAKAERRDVKTGKTSGEDVEVLKGLKKDDVISLDDESEKDKDS
jgi:hypothetical protein